MSRAGNRLNVAIGDNQYELVIEALESDSLCTIDNGVRQRCQYHRDGDSLYFQPSARHGRCVM